MWHLVANRSIWYVTTYAGPNSFNTPLVLTNPPGSNSGVYELILTTSRGCTGISKTIEFTEKPCIACDEADYNMQFDEIVCVYDPVTGAPSYNFQISLTNPFGSSAFTLSTGNGNLNLNPNVTTFTTGVNILRGNFIPVLGSTELCLHFEIKYNVEYVPCGLDLCIDLPVCNRQLPPCDLEDLNLDIWCVGAQDGMAMYDYNLSFNYSGNTGTVTVGTHQGFVSQSTSIINPGIINITGTFTNTPLLDGTVCFDIVIESTDDDGPIWCQDRICAELEAVPPCRPDMPECDLTVDGHSSVCYYVNSFGQIAYVLNYDIHNPSASTYSFYVVSSQGILGAPSPGYIYPSTGTTYTQSFLDVFPTVPQCYTIIATDLSTLRECMIEFCIYPDHCDPGQLRLAAIVDINLYPNPSDNYTIAEYELESRDLADRFTLIDMSGRIIQEIQLNDTRGKVEFDTSSLRAGMYFMKVMNGGQTVMVKKLIIQR